MPRARLPYPAGVPAPLLLHVFPTFVPGGAQVRTVRLMAAFGDAYRHAVLALDGQTSARELVPGEVDLELLPPFPKAGGFATVRALREILSTLRPDLVCTYNWGAMDAVLAGRLFLAGRVIHHEDGFGPDEADGFKRRRVWMRRWMLPRANAVVVPSFTLAELARDLWKLPDRCVFRIANGIRIEEFPAADGQPALRAELGIPTSAFCVGYVGHLRAEKNPVRFVQAFAELSDRGAHGLVLGEGGEREAVERCARELGVADRVHLVGHQKETSRYYRAMDAFCISSNTEQMPVSLLEAMAAHLPVVSTDVGDVARIVPPSQRDLVVPCDASALARALEGVAAAPEERRERGRENHAHVRATYSFETMLEAYRERYDAALAGR